MLICIGILGFPEPPTTGPPNGVPEIGYFGSMRLMGCDGGEGGDLDLPRLLLLLFLSHSSKPTPNLLSVTASRFITKMGTLPDATAEGEGEILCLLLC